VIGLLVALALASIFAVLIGEWIPAGQTDAFYIHRFGERTFRLYRSLGIVNPYGSWWFSILLGLLGLSLLVCSARRLRSTLSTAFGTDLRDDPAQVMRSTLHRKVSLSMNADPARDRIRNLLRGKRYRISERRADERAAMYARRGGVGRLGALLTHIGILLLLAAGIIVSARGYRSTEYGGPGDVLTVPGRSFRIRVDSVDMETTASGAVQDYFSTLTVLDPDSVLTKTIEVNDPLRYGGIDFYQSEFMSDPRRVVDARVLVTDHDTGAPVSDLTLPFQERVIIPDLNLSLRLDDFAADFVINEGGQIGSRSTEPKNPAAKLAIFYEGEEAEPSVEWLFLRFPDMHTKATGQYRFRLAGFTPIYITGLQVARMPAKSLVWAGFVICTLGIFLAFYVAHRRIWVVLESDADGRCKATIGGSANKNRSAFEQEFKAFVAALRDEVGG